MTQHDQNIANDTGAAVRSDINNALAALFGCSSGATAPSTTIAYMFWADTANDLMKQRNAANSAWISLYTLSTAAVANALQLLGATWASPPALGFGSTTPRPVAGTTGSFTSILRALAGCNTDFGTLPTVADATPTHMFNANGSGVGWYIVGASARGLGANYASVRLVNYDGSTVNDVGGFNGGTAVSLITVSGTSVRYQQSSGSSKSDIDWLYLLIGNG